MIPFLSFLSKWVFILFSFVFFLLKWVFVLSLLFCVSVICITYLSKCIISIWLRPSKDELLHQQVKNGNIQGVKALRSKGAGLEWVDIQGKTPLISACTNPDLYDVAKVLIELGADVNAYSRGFYAGTPLHHAASAGLERTVMLLLSHGANALITNDNGQTPLEVARTGGYINVIRGIEDHLCLFSGWLRRIKLPGFLDLLAPQLFSRKVWVVVLPCGSRDIGEPSNLELAIYAGEQDAQPQKIIPLRDADIQEPNFDLPDPVAIINEISKGQRVKLGPVQESEKQQLQRFCNACKGIPQVSNVQATAPHSDDEQLAMAINASLQFSKQERYASQVDSSSSSASSSSGASHNESNTTDTSTSCNASTVVDERTPISGTGVGKKKDGNASTCTICLDTSVEGACVPCGHMAGCMSCLSEIKAKKWGCPICRAKIDQVVRLYAV